MMLSLWIDVGRLGTKAGNWNERQAYRDFLELYEYLRKRELDERRKERRT